MVGFCPWWLWWESVSDKIPPLIKMMKNFNFLINRLSSTGLRYTFNFLIIRLSSTGLKFTLLLIAQFGSIWEGNMFALLENLHVMLSSSFMIVCRTALLFQYLCSIMVPLWPGSDIGFNVPLQCVIMIKWQWISSTRVSDIACIDLCYFHTNIEHLCIQTALLHSFSLELLGKNSIYHLLNKKI